MRLRRHDRIVGPGSLRQSQERTKIGMGRKKVRSSLDARAVRIFKSDALRSSGPNGKGFGRRSASGRLYGRRWYLGLIRRYLLQLLEELLVGRGDPFCDKQVKGLA